MIEFKRIGAGGSPNISTMPDFKAGLIQTLIQNGMRVYDGNPTVNGCPFNFSQFTYNPGTSASYYTMFLVVMNQNVDNMCLLLTSGAALSSAGFTGTSDIAYLAVAYVDNQGAISLSSTSNSYTLIYSLDSYVITTNNLLAITWRVSDFKRVGVCIGDNIWAYTNNTKPTQFFTTGLIAINIPNIAADDPHTLVINKPLGEYGIAAIVFPSNDIVNSNYYNMQYLIQNTTYYCISNPGSTVKYCIY